MSYSGSLDVEIRSWSAAGLEKPSVARLEPAGHRYGSWLGGWTLGRRADIRVSSMGKIVLGHFPEYIALATEIGAELFNMPQDEWDRLDDAGRWEANRKFLDETIDRDDEIVLSTTRVKGGSWFERELRYLAGKGYSPARSGERPVLTRPKQPRT